MPNPFASLALPIAVAASEMYHAVPIRAVVTVVYDDGQELRVPVSLIVRPVNEPAGRPPVA